MADTLEEIYKATLSDSDFDSNGVKTIITTDANTRYVLKDIQVESSLAAVPIKAKLLVNDVYVANIDSSVTGSEIVGPSSTVKVDASTYPLVYADNYYQVIDSSSNLMKNLNATIAGQEEAGLKNIKTSTAAAISLPQNNEFLGYWEGVGPNNVRVRIDWDKNSTTDLRVYNSSGSLLFSDTSNYTPKAFDGSRYVYWYPSGSVIKRYDTHTDTTTDLEAGASAGPSTYAMLLYAGNGLLFGFKNYTSTETGKVPFIYNTITNTYTFDPSGNTAQNSFGNYGSEAMWATSDSSGNVYLAKVNNDSNWAIYKMSSSGSITSLDNSESMSGFSAWSNRGWMSGSDDSKIYFYSNSGRVAFYDITKVGTSSNFTHTSLNFTTTSPLNGHGNLTIGTVTPSASTISSRTYTVNPQVTYRVTGVKSV
jgi:hypothetical protein